MDIRLKDVPGYIVICAVVIIALVGFGTLKLTMHLLFPISEFERVTGYRNVEEMISANEDFLAQIEEKIRTLGITSDDRVKARAGDREAQYRMGNFFLYGDATRKPNYDYAMDWFKKSAAQSYAPAEYQIGRMHANGQGVDFDRKEATKWYVKSAEGGYKWAQIHLGEIYLHFLSDEFGMPRDYREAYFWLSLGTAGDDPHDDFVRDRDNAEHRLTPEEIEAVRKRLEEWRKQHARSDQE
ncbi:MAG: sel1 repeat family protein [Alphaproteobacteria bacterium]|nr:sel1 repeat family protein [Alphaproteobacteria bacterium]